MIGNTIAEVIYGFKDLTDKAQISDDSGWSNRWIYWYLLRYRARLLRQKLREGGRLTQFNYQTINCILLDEVDLSECPCAPVSGCTFRKSHTALPQTIGKIKSVTSVDGQTTYSFVEWERLKNKINSRIAAQANTAYYTLKNTGEGTYLYLYNNVHTRGITVTSIFEDPLEVVLYPTCDGDTSRSECADYLEEKFIIDPDLLPTIYDMAMSQLLRAKSTVSDQVNDDTDTNVQNPPKLK